MKQQPKTSANRPRTMLKVIRYTLVTAGVIIVGLILWIVVAVHLSSQHDKQTIDAAVQAIQLPSNYEVAKTTYQDLHCLDVCAHSVIEYKSRDGTQLSTDVVTAELKSLGYSKQDGYNLSRIYDGQSVHVTIAYTRGVPLTLDVSL